MGVLTQDLLSRALLVCLISLFSRLIGHYRISIAFPFRSVDRSLDPVLGLLICDESMLLFTPKIPFSIQ